MVRVESFFLFCLKINMNAVGIYWLDKMFFNGETYNLLGLFQQIIKKKRISE